MVNEFERGSELTSHFDRKIVANFDGAFDSIVPEKIWEESRANQRPIHTDNRTSVALGQTILMLESGWHRFEFAVNTVEMICHGLTYKILVKVGHHFSGRAIQFSDVMVEN